MRWNATTKTYCAVLVVAVGGLLVDRFALGSGLSGPKVASASMEALPLESGPTAQALPVARHVETAASRLSAVLGLKGNTQIEDAFGGDVKWLAVAAAAKPVGKGEQAAVESQKPFAERHTLTGLSASRSGAGGGGRAGTCVWVDKVKVEVGQMVDGMKLVSVNAQRREATFSGPAGEVVLTLARGGVSENARTKSSNPE